MLLIECVKLSLRVLLGFPSSRDSMYRNSACFNRSHWHHVSPGRLSFYRLIWPSNPNILGRTLSILRSSSQHCPSFGV